MSEFRYDLIHDRYTLIAPNRLNRPNLLRDISISKKSNSSSCPFCQGHEYMTPPEIYSIRDFNGKWLTRVVPNLYKALQIETPFESREEGIYDKESGFGAHEIIIDTPKHIEQFETLSIDEISIWFETIAQRVRDLKRDKRLQYFSIFKNQGKNAGHTIEHIHTQLMALPLLPREQFNILKHLYSYYQEHGRSVFKDCIDYEIDEGVRVIDESQNFLAYCPYASSYPFEIIIMPKIDKAYIDYFSSDELKEFASLLKSSLTLLKSEIGLFDYNLYIQNPPAHKNFETKDYFDDIDNFYRCYLRIIPRLYRQGGFEMQNCMNINPLEPQKAAKLLLQHKG